MEYRNNGINNNNTFGNNNGNNGNLGNLGNNGNNGCSDNWREDQRHVHELVGSVRIADQEDPHNHRFATVTGEAIPCGMNDHYHEVAFRTDFYENHFHEFRGRTGGAVPVGNRHVHFIESLTTVNDGHRHGFEAATLINNPIEDEC
ncbi:MAG: hypothetical protein K0R00_2355 [Herbinix sp.]|jgi:hypothetical protein|nr:hypothetical protein [Herbinix sp.]